MKPSNKENLQNLSKEELVKYVEVLQIPKTPHQKLGLVWDKEREPEKVVVNCKNKLPILEKIQEKQIKTDDSIPHILIEGDNYHALTCLSYTHKGKIDVIYIDPPYNTGAKDWRYNNDHVDKEDSYRHSKWLNMMEKRLELAKGLLSENGFICLAIDHYELFYLGLLMDDIFGEDNRLGIVTVLHNPKGRNLSKFFSENSEYYLVYSRNLDKAIFNSITISDDVKKTFTIKDNEGYYRLENFIRARNEKSREQKPDFWYPIYVSQDLEEISSEKKEGYKAIFPKTKNGEFSWKTLKKTFDKRNKDNFFQAVIVDGEIKIKHKYRENEVIKNVWKEKKYQSEFHGTNLLKNIIGKGKFNFPKSLYAVLDILKITSKKDSIILDFFAGSGTTGHAVMELNKEDGGNRQFILCTNNENNICEEVTYERIKRVIQGYYKNGKMDDPKAYVNGLGGNLEYFKCSFAKDFFNTKKQQGQLNINDVLDVNTVSDSTRIQLTRQAGYLIAIRENTTKEIELNDYYQIFTDFKKEKVVSVYFQHDLSKFTELLEEIQSYKTIILYAMDVESLPKNYTHLHSKSKIFSIPKPILEIYQSIGLLDEI